jgi:hypothetical protein
MVFRPFIVLLGAGAWRAEFDQDQFEWSHGDPRSYYASDGRLRFHRRPIILQTEAMKPRPTSLAEIWIISHDFLYKRG